jgi:mycofactocin precursor
MTELTLPATDEASAASAEDTAEEQVTVTDLLVEEVSIDGMCGVY